MSSNDWRDRAACRELPTEVFFPDERRQGVEVARRVCAVCPVWRECFLLAMRSEGLKTTTACRAGVYAGFTPAERTRLGAELARRGRMALRRPTLPADALRAVGQ